MSLAKTLNGGKQSLKVHINDIRANPNNNYEINNDEVVSLALSIEKYGQLHNGVVYEDEGSEDGKKYTLISGEKRYRAITLLFSQGKHNGMMNVVVQAKPKNLIEMQDVINDANLQRKPDHKTLYKEIKAKEKYYQYLVDNGQRPELYKRDYIAQSLGISSRNVDNIIKEFEGEKNKRTGSTESKRKEYNKDFAKKLKNKYGFTTTVSQKAINFKFTNTDELNEFLNNFLGLNEKYDYSESKGDN